MDRSKSSDNVDSSGASSKKWKYKTDNGQACNWGGRGVNKCSEFSILAAHPCHPHKKFVIG